MIYVSYLRGLKDDCWISMRLSYRWKKQRTWQDISSCSQPQEFALLIGNWAKLLAEQFERQQCENALHYIVACLPLTVYIVHFSWPENIAKNG